MEAQYVEKFVFQGFLLCHPLLSRDEEILAMPVVRALLC